ncbi:kinase-like protein [Ceratobasidium sp. AG-Ba]|nr:kinase-like protein [Ceratobasidium sp. AG-Ba]
MKKISEAGVTRLIDINSRTFTSIAHQIMPLESPHYMHVIQLTSPNDSVLVQLPRMRLSFLINKEAQLESCDFRGLVVDDNQSTGTMYGLRNQLVLKTKDTEGQQLPGSRWVLIPSGSITFDLKGNHPEIVIDRGLDRDIRFYRYKIDTDMGCLNNLDASLSSRLFKVFLHALTSHCLPDPLTGQSGTEEALYELGQSAISSFSQISAEQAQLLHQIGNLTPLRQIYSNGDTTALMTTWAELPSLSQHHSFCLLVDKILRRAQSLDLFSPLESDLDLDKYLLKRDEGVLERVSYRTRIYYPVEISGGFPKGSTDSDCTDHAYEGRAYSSNSWGKQCQIASWGSKTINRRWNQPTYTNCDLTSRFEQWDDVHGPVANLQLTYSREWLEIQLPTFWLSLYNLCRQPQQQISRYSFVVCIVASIYSGSIPADLVPIFISFVGNSPFWSLAPPPHPSYKLSDGYSPTADRVASIIYASRRDLAQTPASGIQRKADESDHDWNRRKASDYNLNISKLQAQLAKIWADSWPRSPSGPSDFYSAWFEVSKCLQQVQLYFNSCSRNLEIQRFLREVERELSSNTITPDLECSIIPPSKPKPITRKSILPCPLASFSLSNLMHLRAKPELTEVPREPVLTNSAARLKSLLAEFCNEPSHRFSQRYGSDLEASRMDLFRSDSSQTTASQMPSISSLKQNRDLCHSHLVKSFNTIQDWLGPVTTLDNIVYVSGVWPRLTPRNILSKLSLRFRNSIPLDHQMELCKYARAYVEYQRSQRLIGLALDAKHDEFFKELKLANAKPGDQTDSPDWLLVQIDGNFSARKIQTQIACEMITPSSGISTVLQLNMGEGKSSVIVPIVAATLADTTRLVRVLVLKPLWRQMFQLLVSRLAGIVNRRIYYMPFGRHIEVGEAQVKQIHEMYNECMREGGVLLVQPEHVLSLKMMAIDHLLLPSTSKSSKVANTLRKTQKWLSKNARDILDESDELLHVRYQLIYTVGDQEPLHGHPDRWTTTQQIFPLIASHIRRLKQIYPGKLKFNARDEGQFPSIRILPESDELIGELITSIAKDVMEGLVPNLNFSLLPQETRCLVQRFMVEHDIPEGDVQPLKNLNQAMRNGILLLRGLLASGIIVFALRDRRYRVDYGLDLNRSLLAVPYHAKDVPSPRAEFGHPDVAIVLTCLSYYNSGLTNTQLETCFLLLYKLHNPALEYESWVHQNKNTPPNLRQLIGVNLKDREQFSNHLVPTFSRNLAVVNFFLSSVVFPKEAKGFPHKLSTSGWDLAEIKNHVTTGFSGTNDNRYLLPTSITQSDPVGQSSTNALVLTYLLQPENNHYLRIPDGGSGACSTAKFLSVLVKQEPEVRVLLDVGAQILEFQNDQLVKHWLKLRPDIAAGVYFDEKDDLVIIPQDGSPVPFQSSPFAQQMDKCIVYLDDGHTRGTDLKLPVNTRAAVTVGPKVTKDRLLQGCMRMRKLGFGQSVMFCAPAEIDEQIRKASNIGPDEQVDTLAVIRWAMVETCKDLERNISHWAQQGVEYTRRADAEKRHNETGNIEDLKSGWLVAESRSLEEMYDVSDPVCGANGSFTSTALQTPGLKERLEQLGVQKLEHPGMDEEQEREVSHELEQERQVQRPPKSEPAVHFVHPEVKRFVQIGALPLSGLTAIIPLFNSLEATGALQSGAWSSKLFASLDFCKALNTTDETRLTEYMRPVNWILSGPGGVLLVLSPYEVNELLPDIQKSSFVRLHIFSPRVSESMCSFSDLKFYSMPSRINSRPFTPDPMLQLQLGLFAGQLYFDNYDEYRAVCAFLGVFVGSEATRESYGIEVQSDGFVNESDRQKLAVHIPQYGDCNFTMSPVGGIHDLVGYRRKGMEYLRTHLGQVLHARQLSQDDFQHREPSGIVEVDDEHDDLSSSISADDHI